MGYLTVVSLLLMIGVLVSMLVVVRASKPRQVLMAGSAVVLCIAGQFVVIYAALAMVGR